MPRRGGATWAPGLFSRRKSPRRGSLARAAQAPTLGAKGIAPEWAAQALPRRGASGQPTGKSPARRWWRRGPRAAEAPAPARTEVRRGLPGRAGAAERSRPRCRRAGGARRQDKGCCGRGRRWGGDCGRRGAGRGRALEPPRRGEAALSVRSGRAPWRRRRRRRARWGRRRGGLRRRGRRSGPAAALLGDRGPGRPAGMRPPRPWRSAGTGGWWRC